MHKSGILCCLAGLAFVACSNDLAVINRIIDTEADPDLVGYNVDMWYSDSARLQMMLKAPEVRQFTGEKDPRDEFPHGLHVWFYEKDGKLKAEVTANWALNDHTKKLWEARDKVVVINDKGERLESEQMFWDQEKGTVYSNKFTKYIGANGNIATGRGGMQARQDFSQWKLLNGNATIKFDDETAPTI